MSQIRAEQIEQIEAIKHDIEAIVEAKRSLFQNLLQLRNDLDRNAGDRWPSFVLRNATSTEINGALGEAVENLPADWVDETHRGERNPEPDWFDIANWSQAVTLNGIKLDVIGVPTVREADGLALSSRNVYLSDEERRQ